MKISGLTALTGANTATGDLLEIVDVSDTTMAATGTNKKITLTELMGAGTVPGTFTTLTSTGNAALGDAEATDTHAIKGATTLLANSASAALTVTQTGAGNAFVVEDSASTDSTPFCVNGSGQTLIGSTTVLSVGGASNQGLQVTGGTGAAQRIVTGRYSNDVNAAAVFAFKSRSTTEGAYTILQSGDPIFQIRAYGDDGATLLNYAGMISFEVDGTPGTNDMPGRLVFSTTADGASSPTERMRIDSAGQVGFGRTPTNGFGVHVGKSITGAASARAFAVTGDVLTGTTDPYGVSVGLNVPDTVSITSAILFYTNGVTLGGSGAATSQYGFRADSGITLATNNYGFYSNIASAANRYNFYAAGSAPNYFAGVISGGDGATFVGNVIAYNGTAVPAGGIAGVGYKFSTTSNFGVFFGSGAPTLSAAKGSIYLRSDGSGTSDRMYVNTNGSTGWAAVTTAS